MRNEGFLIGLCIVLIVALSMWLGFSAGVQTEHSKFYNYWSNDCREDGGTVQMTNPNSTECFKEGLIINHVD